jgi:hypothetical protein
MGRPPSIYSGLRTQTWSTFVRNHARVIGPEAGKLKVGMLAESLADFVYAHRDANANFDWPDVPEGYIHIGVFPAVDPPSRWRSV